MTAQFAGTTPAAVMTSRAAWEVMKSKNAFAAPVSPVSALVTSTKGRWMA